MRTIACFAFDLMFSVPVVGVLVEQDSAAVCIDWVSVCVEPGFFGRRCVVMKFLCNEVTINED